MSIPNNNNKDPKSMKGLLKGLRYISQIFDNEKEAEMQIGNPTDVKHVAHIGWDGNNDSPPTWMTEFKEQSESSSPNGNRAMKNANNPTAASSLQPIPEDDDQTEQRSNTTSPRKSSKQQTSLGGGEVENKHHRQTRKASKNTSREVQNPADGASKSTTRSRSKDGSVDSKVEEAPKKLGRRKNSKESAGPGSKSKPKAATSAMGGGHDAADAGGCLRSEHLSEQQGHISSSVVL